MNRLDIDYTSLTWRVLKAHIENDIESLRDVLEGAHDALAIARTQGKIEVLREILDNEKEAPVIRMSNPY